jgi:hypothetical protein
MTESPCLACKRGCLGFEWAPNLTPTTPHLETRLLITSATSLGPNGVPGGDGKGETRTSSVELIDLLSCHLME